MINYTKAESFQVLIYFSYLNQRQKTVRNKHLVKYSDLFLLSSHILEGLNLLMRIQIIQ